MSKGGKLTVLLVTYNHENYIAHSLNSILAQKIDIVFDIMVADDVSSDSTLNIIREIDQLNPSVEFHYLENSENLGITKNYERSFAACRSEYVAVMEGDDYWVSPFKLRKQLDFLESHWECEMCATNYYVFEEKKCHYYLRTPETSGYRCLTSRNIIEDNLIGNFSTCMYRVSSLRKLPPNLFKIKSYDWITNICIGMHGLLGFIYEPMSVYRLHSDGIWSAMSPNEQLQIQLETINPYDEVSEHVFSDSFNILSNRIKKQMVPKQFSLEPPVYETSTLKSKVQCLIDMMPPAAIILLKYILPPILIRKVVSIWSQRS